MAKSSAFSLIPREIKSIKSNNRKIHGLLPLPRAESVFDELDVYESRSMHGQIPIIWDRAVGHNVYDNAGNEWIDFTSTIFVSNCGHSHPKIKKALINQINSDLIHSYTYPTDIRSTYLRRLIEATPKSLEKSFLLSSGTEATEVAYKLIRLHGQKIGKRRTGVVAFEGAMHGRTLAAALLGGSEKSRDWIGFDDPDIHRLQFPSPWACGRKNAHEQAKNDIRILMNNTQDPKKDIAGIMIESYQGWGAIFYPPEYIKIIAEFALKNDILLCFDEIQSGFGRTGKMFAYEHYGVEADLVCAGKGMGSGLPLSGVLGRENIMDLPDIGSMSSTHSANPLVCAAGLATLEVMAEENLVNESARKGAILSRSLFDLKEKYPDIIKYVFGKGLVSAALFFDPHTGEPDGELASKICEICMFTGLLVVHTGRESIKFGPPLTISDDALLEGLSIFSDAVAQAIAEKYDWGV